MSHLELRFCLLIISDFFSVAHFSSSVIFSKGNPVKSIILTLTLEKQRKSLKALKLQGISDFYVSEKM